MKNIKWQVIVNKIKNVFIAAVVFGSIGAYVGIQTMYAIDARQDNRINAVLKANGTEHNAPVATNQVK